MNEILLEIREFIKKGYFINEENVRFSLVARILQELGWNIWNPKEVSTEFKTVPNEDKSRVDIALFDNSPTPSAFIEIKAIGKLEYDLARHEVQLRDYNRNNTALFSIITDGQLWRFYYSQTGGEFFQKCFKIIDLLKDELDDIELSFYAFLSKEEIRSGNARNEAETYLTLSQKQRSMEDAFSEARRQVLEPPFPSLPEAIIAIVEKEGYKVLIDEACSFVKKQGKKKQIPEKQKIVKRTSKPSRNKRIESEPEYITKYRIQLDNQNSLPSKIKRYIFEYGPVTRGKIKTACVNEFGCKSKTSGSIGASIKLLEFDGYINVIGHGDSTIISKV